MPKVMLAACVLLALLAAAAHGKDPLTGPRPVAESALYADRVVLGKVVEVEKETVGARRYANSPKSELVTYTIASVQVAEAVIGTRGVTRIRVGFPAETPAALEVGSEGVFFLEPHHSGNFHILPLPGRLFLSATDKAYLATLADIRGVAKVYDDPVAALKAKDKDARLLAAKALVYRYYRPRWTSDGARWPKEDLSKFLKENADKVWLKRFVAPKGR